MKKIITDWTNVRFEEETAPQATLGLACSWDHGGTEHSPATLQVVQGLKKGIWFPLRILSHVQALFSSLSLVPRGWHERGEINKTQTFKPVRRLSECKQPPAFLLCSRLRGFPIEHTPFFGRIQLAKHLIPFFRWTQKSVMVPSHPLPSATKCNPGWHTQDRSSSSTPSRHIKIFLAGRYLATLVSVFPSPLRLDSEFGSGKKVSWRFLIFSHLFYYFLFSTILLFCCFVSLLSVVAVFENSNQASDVLKWLWLRQGVKNWPLNLILSRIKPFWPIIQSQSQPPPADVILSLSSPQSWHLPCSNGCLDSTAACPRKDRVQ